MSPALASILALLATVFLMLVGNGLASTIIPLRARAEGFSGEAIGLLGSAYFGGMLFGALVATRFIRRLGHIRTIAACIVLATVATLALSLFGAAWVWIAMRFVSGFAFAGLYATIEAWLQGRASDSNRGRVLALYSVMQYAGWGAGNQLLGLAEPTSHVLFSLAATALCLAILPLMLTDADPPEPPRTPSLRLGAIWRDSPIGFVGAVAIGVVNGPFWALTPTYAADLGLAPVAVGTFMTMLTLGSALFQVPVGRISDRMDRRKLLLGLCTLTGAFEIGIALVAPEAIRPMILGVALLLGGAVATQYYVIAAHANDRAAAQDSARISAALLLLYCIGAAIGPSSAALMMKVFGPGGLHLHNGVVHVALACFVLLRILRRPPPLRPADDSASLTLRPAP